MRREIRTYIQRQIAQGVYRPGDRIVETQLAREMNVSQAPVREALLELAAMGLVEERPYSGTFVRHLKASDGAPSADSIGPMLVHDARVVAAGPAGEREIPLHNFYLGLKKLDLRPDELLARIRIPAPPAHSGSFYIKYTRRDAMDLALLGVSTYVELTGDTLKTVRIALTTAAPTPIRAFETERILTGRPAVEETFLTAGKAVLQESHPRSSWRSSAEFRLALVEELTAQALRQAAAVAKEA